MSSIICKAAVALGPKQDLCKIQTNLLEIMDIEVLPPAPGEVRVKVLYTGVCHTDEYTRSGLDPEGVFPSILGHEGGGVVESIGEGVTEFAIGDHVIPLYIPQCRKCKYCKSTKTNLCQSVRPTQGRGLMPDQTARFKIVSTGESVFHFMGCSTFSQYTVLPEVSLVKINKEAPLDKVCLLGCGITTGYGAVINTLKVEAGASVLVIGLGGVGLAAIMGASKVGATRIIGVDINAGKFERAMQFGATDVINPLDKEKYGSKMLPEIIFDLTEGVGVDYSIECVGTPFTMKQAFECTKPNGGCSCVIGVAASGQFLELDAKELYAREWTGSAFGGAKSKDDVPKYVDEYMKGEIKVDEFITHHFPLSEIMHSFEAMHKGECIRAIIDLWAD